MRVGVKSPFSSFYFQARAKRRLDHFNSRVISRLIVANAIASFKMRFRNHKVWRPLIISTKLEVYEILTFQFISSSGETGWLDDSVEEWIKTFFNIERKPAPATYFNQGESKADPISKIRYISSYRSKRVWNSRLSPTQPDLIDPVRCLTWLNTDRVTSTMLQFDGNWIIGITCPPIDTGRMDIQAIPQSDTSPLSPYLIIHLQPDRIRIAAVYIGFAS